MKNYYNINMKINEQDNFQYSSDYETLNDFCNELYVAFNELFICDVKRDNNVFDVEFKDGSKFRLTVEEQK